jgi:hypothetical protein
MNINSALTSTVTAREFSNQVRHLGLTVTSSTIRRWSSEGLVAPPSGTTYAARWPVRALGDAALVFRLREGNPLYAATSDGVRVARALVDGLLDGALRWDRIWLPTTVSLHNYEWQPGREQTVDTFLFDGVLAFFKGVAGVPLLKPVSASIEWHDDDDSLHVELEPEVMLADGVGAGDSIGMPMSRASIGRIRRAVAAGEVK